MFEKVGLQIRCFYWELKQTDRQTDRQRSKQTNKQTNKQTHTHTHKQTNKQTSHEGNDSPPNTSKKWREFQLQKDPTSHIFLRTVWDWWWRWRKDRDTLSPFLLVPSDVFSLEVAFFQKTSGVPHHQHHIKGIFCRPTATFWIVQTLWTVYCKESKIKPYRESQNRPKVLWISGILDQKTLQNLWLFQKRQICDVALPFFASAEKKTPRGWTTSGTDSAPRTVRPRPWILALRIGYDTPW